jgi:hypothetical protein
MKFKIGCIYFTLFLLFSVYSKLFCQETILYVNDTAMFAGDFGNGVGSFNDWVIFGDIGGNPDFPLGGAAYVFKKEGTEWIEEAKLIPSTPQAQARFGASGISVYENRTVVGAERDNQDFGGAYVFKRDGEAWIEEAKLQASDGNFGDRFGYAVAIYEDYAAVGALDDSDIGYGIGSVYIFRRNGDTWTEETKLIPSDGMEYDRFGASLDMEGDYMVIGAPGNTNEPGSAYVYKKTGEEWQEMAHLFPPAGVENNNFGSRVAISAGKIIASIRYEASQTAPLLGAAYIFRQEGNEWVEEALLLPFDNTTNDDYYCFSVDIKDDIAAFTLPGEHNSGRIFVFQYNGNTWEEKTIITPSNQNNYDQFGRSMVINGQYLITGAPGNNSNPIHRGAGYVYDLDILLSTGSEILAEEVKIYPNPVTNTLHIKAEINTSSPATLSIYDLNGRLVQSIFQGLNGNSISVSHLTPGIYTLILKENGVVIGTKKFVKF